MTLEQEEASSSLGTLPRDYDYEQLLLLPPRRHSQRTSIQHWQLRDLVCFPDTAGLTVDGSGTNSSTSNCKSDTVCTVNNTVVYAYGLQSHQANVLLRDLPFAPTCMHARHGFVAIGGQRSQVIVKSLQNPQSAIVQTTVGGAINNAIHVFREGEESDRTRLLVCNNDETIKVFALPDMTHLGDIKFDGAVNHVSTSPDGQLIAATGDAGNVGIYAVSSDRGYEQVALLRQVCEAGFSTSWDSASQQLAVAGQDGLVSVFDIRAIMAAGKFDDGLCRMARLESSQKGPKGAARCVKFSQTMSMDLLAFSEHCSFVNVFDARTFEKRQRIRLSQPNTDLHITGLDFSPDSQRLVIGLEQSLLEFDVNSLQRRSFASACFH